METLNIADDKLEYLINYFSKNSFDDFNHDLTKIEPSNELWLKIKYFIQNFSNEIFLILSDEIKSFCRTNREWKLLKYIHKEVFDREITSSFLVQKYIENIKKRNIENNDSIQYIQKYFSELVEAITY